MGEVARVGVIGNINIDLVFRVEAFPEVGETMLAQDFKYLPGGKAANQAVAASRLGAEVFIVGRVGDDAFGEVVLANLKEQGVDTSFVHSTHGVSTGMAFVTSRRTDGANSILSYPGANRSVLPKDVDAASEQIKACDIILIQLGVGLETVDHAIKTATEYGVPVVVDPTPLGAGLPERSGDAAVLTPNLVEMKKIAGTDNMEQAAGIFCDMGLSTVVVKAGERGCYVLSGGKVSNVPAFEGVDVKDTTGAGDTFNAALAVRMAKGDALVDAALFANAAGALATAKLGAQEAMPTGQMVMELLSGV